MLKQICLMLFLGLWSLPTWAQKKEALALEPGLYISTSKVFLDGKPSDPYSEDKKKAVAIKDPKKRQEAIQNVRNRLTQEICVTPSMLQPQQFYKNLSDSRMCNYKLTRATSKQMTAEFNCGEVRGKGLVTTRVLTPQSYESAYVGGKGPKGESIKVVAVAKKTARHCSPKINNASGTAYALPISNSGEKTSASKVKAPKTPKKKKTSKK